MSLFDWLFPSNWREREADGGMIDQVPQPPPDIRDRLVLTLLPQAFDPDGDGDLMWYGCVLQNQTGSRYAYDNNRVDNLGLHIFRVAGVSRRKREPQDSAFAPPNFVSLLKEDTNPYDLNAVAVWDSNQKVMVSYTPREKAKAIRRTMIDHRQARGLVLAHSLKKKTGVGLTNLFGRLDGLT